MNLSTLTRNRHPRLAVTLLAISCCLAFAYGPTIACGQDSEPTPGIVLLKSGGTIEGKISVGNKSDNGRSYVAVYKGDGSVIKLDQSRLVRKVELANSKTFEYQRLAASASSVEDHQKILSWCLDQPRGKRVFESEIQTHAHHILKSLPNDEQARRVLGFEREDEAWVQKDHFFGEHGYTRDGTSWTTIRGAQLQAQEKETDEIKADRKVALRKWLRVARRGDLTDDELVKALFEFCDNFALSELEAVAQREKRPGIRAVMLEGLGRIENQSAMRMLVKFAMEDPDAFVRERALTLLGQPHFDAQAASRAFAEFFSSKQNAQIQRAAHAIGELGGTSMVGELIEVLVTTHTEQNPNALAPGRMNTTFTDDGGAGLSTGGGPQTITVARQNDRVLNALKVLTDQNLDFDIAQWREWNIKSNTRYNISVRND